MTGREYQLDARSAAGLIALRGIMPVPQIYTLTNRGEPQLFMEDILASKRSQHLLGEAISAADNSDADVTTVRHAIRQVCDSWQTSIDLTGDIVPLSQCVPGLYRSRLAPKGRLEQWYARHSGIKVPALFDTRPTQLRHFGKNCDFILNGRPYGLNVLDSIEQARRMLPEDSQWMSALTQGDPTEPNIGVEPLCWLDFEYAGRNTICGEVSNLLWYLVGLGGWLVPTCQPKVFARTLPNAKSYDHPLIKFTTTRSKWSYIDVRVRWDMGLGRAAALDELIARLSPGRPLYEACLATTDSNNLMDALRPWLITRILGVIPPTQMQPDQILGCLSALAVVSDPATTIDSLLADLGQEVKPWTPASCEYPEHRL
ncbi:hypothetical protein [Natronoglycomyces albus]|uniref:Uncharacterized protein n=1 Tax=Natronoglycomyces albus TaxID=2811108 RepID=A0A895XDT4_9ACTN|nr:hypothetical protein [Natronoglycomyces albus]QSB03961.1 hypothetical protein JQS30_08995 [Natronoglycomyces albus]